MYGLEKDPDGKKKKFVFDLEREIHDKPSRGKEILQKTEKRMNEIKKHLREGASEKDFDRLGILLQGYAALQRVLKKVVK